MSDTKCNKNTFLVAERNTRYYRRPTFVSKIRGTPHTFAIELQYIHVEGTARKELLNLASSPSSQNSVGFCRQDIASP